MIQKIGPVNLKNKVYEALKKYILSLNIYLKETDFHLDERQLSEKLGVSRTPIREAVARLEQEGIVKTVPTFKIKVPQIMNTIVVVWTTITIVVLKVFDIVFAMTNGQWETQVLANYMYDKLFRSNDWGVGSASAMIIMLLVTPILVWNVYNARKEMR